MPTTDATTTDAAAARRADRAARVAVEELTGLALQEGALTRLLRRHASEAPLGGPRERLEAHVAQSERHARRFAELAQDLRAHRGPGELALGLLRSGFVVVAGTAAGVAQLASLPVTLRRGGGEERLLENAGVEGAALANKLVILTAVCRSSERSGDEATHAALAELREEAQASWDGLLGQVPELMDALVSARSHEPSFDFRTAGGPESRHDRSAPRTPGATSATSSGSGASNGSSRGSSRRSTNGRVATEPATA